MTSQRMKIRKTGYWLDVPPLPSKFKNLILFFVACFGYFICVMNLRYNPYFGNYSFIWSTAHTFYSDIVYIFLLFLASLFSLSQHIYFSKRNIYLGWANLLYSGVCKPGWLLNCRCPFPFFLDPSTWHSC